jgi:cytochrome bd-type quinol oxidase subunit 2
MSDTSKPVRSLGDFLQVFAPPLIWFAHLTTVYVAESLICIAPPAIAATVMAWTIAVATVVAIAGLLLTAWLLRRGNARRTQNLGSSRFLVGVSYLLVLLSILGVVWTLLPTIVLPTCVSSRSIDSQLISVG